MVVSDTWLSRHGFSFECALRIPLWLCNQVSPQSLPWTCVWYTTKYSSFPQLSNSSPRQRWRHMSSFSNSWREKRGVGKPQWHRSPARTASDFSWNAEAVLYTVKALTYTNVQYMNKHIGSPSPCTCPHTCQQTCFGWWHWKEGLWWHCLACGNSLLKWHYHLKHTKLKCYTPTGKWPTIDSSFTVTELSFHPIGLCSLTPEKKTPLRLSLSLLRLWPSSGLNQWQH